MDSASQSTDSSTALCADWPDPGRRRRFAERWLSERAERIRAAVCDEPAVRAILDKDTSDRVTELAAVADALVTLAGGHASATVIAVIRLRRDAETVCSATSF